MDYGNENGEVRHWNPAKPDKQSGADTAEAVFASNHALPKPGSAPGPARGRCTNHAFFRGTSTLLESLPRPARRPPCSLLVIRSTYLNVGMKGTVTGFHLPILSILASTGTTPSSRQLAIAMILIAEQAWHKTEWWIGDSPPTTWP